MKVLFEDNHILSVNKQCGDIVQGDKTGDTPLLEIGKQYIKDKYNKPGEVYLGLPHRLDRPTSGVILFARTSKALTRLNKMFQSKADIQKTYWAVVEKAPTETEATLEHWLVRNEKQNKSYAYNKEEKNSKHAALRYKLIASSERYHLLEIELITGRHHQIRSQLAKIGCIIKGDLKYGAKRSNPDGGIHLHARKIAFKHPVGDQMVEITAPVPNDKLWQAFEKMV